MIRTDDYICEVTWSDGEMTEISRTYMLSNEQIEEYPFVKDGRPAFYFYLARQLGHNPEEADNIRFDCTKINISNNIQDKWFCGIPQSQKTSFAMLLVCSGPKTDDSLPDNVIMIDDGFISYED